MKWGIQKTIARAANISEPSVSQFIRGHRRPVWKIAKKLAKITATTPELWLEGTPDEIRMALEIAHNNTIHSKEDDERAE